MLVHRHPFFELAHVTARSEAGARLDDLHPRTRVPMELESWDPDVQGDVDAALVCWPHRAAAPAVAALRERGVRVVDLSRRLPPARPRHLRGLVRRPRRARAVRPGRLRPARAAPRRDRGRRPRRQPRLLPDRRAARRSRRSPAPACIGDVIIDAKSGVSGAGREPTATTHFISADENMTPYKVERHRHTPEIEQELAGQGADRSRSRSRRTSSRSRRASSSPATSRRRASYEESEVLDLYDEAYAREPWVELRLGPPGVLDVRETNYCAALGPLRRADGPDPRLRRDRQPVEGRRVAGRAEPQRDVRPRRAGRALRTVTVRLALGRAARDA